MGAFLDKPIVDKVNASGSGNGLRFAVAAMQGWRIEMEDAHFSQIGLKDLPNWSLFAVFDGHAGSGVSTFASAHIEEEILNHKQFLPCVTELERKMASDGKADVKSEISCLTDVFRQVFLDIDVRIKNLPEVQNGNDRSGSTAVVAVIGPSHIFLVNCGDSRGIIVSDNQIVCKTEDHKPHLPSEHERITRAGGSVMLQRVNGSLAVSRALGDFEYKSNNRMAATEQLVSPQPDIYVHERNAVDEYMVLACDGIWDVMTSDEARQYLNHRLQRINEYPNLVNETLDTCLYKGSRDNMSVIFVAFDGITKVDAEQVEREKVLDNLIERRIRDYLTEPNQVELAYILHTLSSDNELFSYLPPVGGILTKRNVVEESLKRLSPHVSD
ncbi:hypothetical protein SNEBB_009922 [Seison nebaliae]|nr:hypothetical protein SNEBB_009922 [Seison nebaliae]